MGYAVPGRNTAERLKMRSHANCDVRHRTGTVAQIGLAAGAFADSDPVALSVS